MAKNPQSATSLEASPEEERRGRILRYSVAMSIRFVCVILMMILHGWLMWVAAAGAIFLPYIAVVIANAQGAGAKRSKAAAAVTAKPLVISADQFTVVNEPSVTNATESESSVPNVH